LGDAKAPSENELGKYSYSESEFASKDRSANKSDVSRDELIKSQSGEFKKNLRPIDEVDE